MIPYFFLVFASFYLFSEHLPKAEKVLLWTYIACMVINAYTIIGYLMFGRSRAMANDIYYTPSLMQKFIQVNAAMTLPGPLTA